LIKNSKHMSKKFISYSFEWQQNIQLCIYIFTFFKNCETKHAFGTTLNHNVICTYYHMASSVSGQDELNPAL